MKNQRINLTEEKLRSLSEQYFNKKCGFFLKTEKNKTMMREAEKIRNLYQDQVKVKLLLSEYPSSSLWKGQFQFENVTVPCGVLQKIHPEQIWSIYVYALCLEEIPSPSSGDLLETFYLDTWMTSLVDAARDWIKTYTEELAKKQAGNRDVFMTESFGPGFYGMELCSVQKFFQIMDTEQIGLRFSKKMMIPAKSNVGLFLALKEKFDLPSRDCINCLGNKGSCEFCKNYVPSS